MVTNGHIYPGRDQRIVGHSGRARPRPLHYRARRMATPERIPMAEETWPAGIKAIGLDYPPAQLR